VYSCVFQDVSNDEYDCVVGRRWPSYAGTSVLVGWLITAVSLEPKDAKSLPEESMNGVELRPALYSAEWERRCASCCCGDGSGVCSSFGPSLISC
jgi:hypothetical protein